MNVISIDSAHKTFGFGDATVHALDDVSINVKKGEFVIVMGPSGSGKSTLMNILGLLESTDKGTYSFSGQEIKDTNGKDRAKIRRNKIGFVFQSFNLLPRLTTLENVALPLTYRGIPHTEKLEQAAEALSEVGLEDRQYYYPHELSGGQHQRAAIARAIVGKPDLILADEPTGNLDSGTSKLVMGMLKRFHGQGHTIVMVTHNTELLEYADRVVFMKDGKIDSISQANELTKQDIDKAEKEQIKAARKEISPKKPKAKVKKKKPASKKKPSKELKTTVNTPTKKKLVKKPAVQKKAVSKKQTAKKTNKPAAKATPKKAQEKKK